MPVRSASFNPRLATRRARGLPRVSLDSIQGTALRSRPVLRTDLQGCRLPWRALAAVAWIAVTLSGVSASAQEATEDEGLSRTGATEGVDRTRLDVERLPAEAIPITRDLYAHGFFVEANVGARGFIGGVGRISDPGLFVAARFGYELLDWLWVSAVGEASIHQTNAPAPPSRAVFELMGALAEVRLQVNPTAEFAMWLGGQIGFLVSTTDVLSIYGMPNVSTIGLAYGGEAGMEAHFHSRHYSLGISGGARLSPSLDGFDGEIAIGIFGGPYLRCVF